MTFKVHYNVGISYGTWLQVPEDLDWSGSTLTGAHLYIQVTNMVGPVPLLLGTSDPIGTHITYRQPYQLTCGETPATGVGSPKGRTERLSNKLPQ